MGQAEDCVETKKRQPPNTEVQNSLMQEVNIFNLCIGFALVFSTFFNAPLRAGVTHFNNSLTFF